MVAKRKSSEVDLTPINSRISALEQTIQDLQSAIDGYTDKMNTLQSTANELSSQISSAKVSETVARSVAATALGSAIENGEALAIPLSSIEALIGANQDTKRLIELSENGIAGLDEIKRGFDEFASAVLAPEPSQEGDLVSRLLQNAQSLVSIRPSDPVEGDDVPAILSRIRGHILSGDLDAIVGEWSALPNDVQASGKNWIDTVNSRLEALSLYEKISLQLNEVEG